MMDKIYSMIGNGDPWIGMKAAIMGFMTLIGFFIVIMVILLLRNHSEKSKKRGVSLESVVATKKKEDRKKGVFNYDILDADDDESGDDGENGDKNEPRPAVARQHPRRQQVKLSLHSTSHRDNAPRHAEKNTDNPFER